jgi:hypothetical protein
MTYLILDTVWDSDYFERMPIPNRYICTLPHLMRVSLSKRHSALVWNVITAYLTYGGVHTAFRAQRTIHDD